MSLILCGCGGQPLSQREIVRGIFFTHQDQNYSVCLVLASQEKEESAAQNRIVAAEGTTPAQALQHAENSLKGSAYYGLLDLAALPADTDWQMAQEIGTLLYDNAQPAPELSLFLLDTESVKSWATQGAAWYEAMKALETTSKVHCGLQQLFTQDDGCAVPAYREAGGYDFVLLPRDGSPLRYSGLAHAQLAAILCGQTNRLQGSYASGQATCSARAQITVDGTAVQLHLRDTKLKSLSGQRTPLQDLLSDELEQAFADLYQAIQPTGADPFHMKFWQASTYGMNCTVLQPHLEVYFE